MTEVRVRGCRAETRDHNEKMIEVARQVLAAAETFRALEEVPGR